MPLAITPTFSPWTHTSDDSYIYQLSLGLATATVSFISTTIAVCRLQSESNVALLLNYQSSFEQYHFFTVLYLVRCCNTRTKTPIQSPWVPNDLLSKNEDSRSGLSFLWYPLNHFSGKDSEWSIIKTICDYSSNSQNHVLSCSRHHIAILSRRIVAKGHTIVIRLVLVFGVNY